MNIYNMNQAVELQELFSIQDIKNIKDRLRSRLANKFNIHTDLNDSLAKLRKIMHQQRLLKSIKIREAQIRQRLNEEDELDKLEKLQKKIEDSIGYKPVTLPTDQADGTGKVDIGTFHVKHGQMLNVGNSKAMFVKVKNIDADNDTITQIEGRNDGGMTKIDTVNGGDVSVIGGLILL